MALNRICGCEEREAFVTYDKWSCGVTKVTAGGMNHRQKSGEVWSGALSNLGDLGDPISPQTTELIPPQEPLVGGDLQREERFGPRCLSFLAWIPGKYTQEQFVASQYTGRSLAH